MVLGMQVVGMVREQDLLPLLSDASNGSTPDMSKLPSVEHVMRPPAGYLRAGSSMAEAAEKFTATEAEMLPVVTEQGGYAGYMLRSDVMAALSNSIRPQMVGGLATPIGVHLTCGSQRGGVSDLGLILMGVLFGLLNLAGLAVFGALMWLGQRYLGQPLYASLLSEPTAQFSLYNMILYVAGAAPVIALGLGIRFLPVSGYHAAEHQTVHAIEQGEPLEYEAVRRMPRVHPRCGTNLAAAAAIFIFLITTYPSPLVVLGAIIFVLMGWRSIGGWLQHHVTTRTPNRKQILSGIKAGEELLANYRDEVLGNRPAGTRLWNLGFAQIFIGLLPTMVLGGLLFQLLGLNIMSF